MTDHPSAITADVFPHRHITVQDTLTADILITFGAEPVQVTVHLTFGEFVDLLNQLTDLYNAYAYPVQELRHTVLAEATGEVAP